MGKHDRNPSDVLDPLRPVNYIRHPDIKAGAPDITRPRDIYSFLSLGYISTDLKTSISSQKKRAAAGLSLSDQNNIYYRSQQHTGTGSISSSTHTDWDQSNPSSYILFDTLNTHTKLPAIHTEGIKENENDDVCLEENETNQLDAATTSLTPRKSLINEEDHKINITQTYIFAPPDRLQETFKYNKNIVLPKIKPKKISVSGEKPPNDQEAHLVLAPSDVPAAEDTQPTFIQPKQVRINPKPTEISAKAPEMNANNYIFGARPECLFLNHRLGDKNPLLRTHKESPTLSVPKASPGLYDLKDYDEYPNVYWQLRDSTITQPEDLEADMIDRDLYRLRQISTLKLNSIEKTFQVHQDPFRRWRWKPGEPVFSPRQQQRPTNRSYREKKLKDIPIYPQALPRPRLRVSVSQLKPAALEFNEVLTAHNIAEHQQKVQEMDISKQNDDYHVSKVDTPFQDVPALLALDTPRGSTPGQTPREVVAASLESFRNKDQVLAEGDEFGKIPVQKIHQLKGKQNKLPVKTALVKVDLEPIESYKKEHRNASTKPICKDNSKGVGHSHKLESFREQMNGCADEHVLSKVNTSRSEKGQYNFNDDIGVAATAPVEEEGGDIDNEGGSNSDNTKKVPAPVSTLLLQPDLSRLSLYPPGDIVYNWDTDTGTLTSAAAMVNNRSGGVASPVVSDSSGAVKEKQRKNGNNTPMRPVKLQVFSERVGGGIGGGGGGRDGGSGATTAMDGGAGEEVITIPTGRISYLKGMPAYKLDLVNYPPSNARQSCQRSSSAGISDGRRTHYTTTTNNPMTPRSRNQRVKSSAGAGGAQAQEQNIPPKTGDTNISIRFGQQGQVIVSSSREGRRSR